MPDLSQQRTGVAGKMWRLFAVYQAICQLTGAGVDAAGTQERICFLHALAASSTVTVFPDRLDSRSLLSR